MSLTYSSPAAAKIPTIRIVAPKIEREIIAQTLPERTLFKDDSR